VIHNCNEFLIFFSFESQQCSLSLSLTRAKARGYNSGELPGVDPFLLEHAPEVLGQPTGQIFVRQSAVAVLAPAGAPGIAYQERALGRRAPCARAPRACASHPRPSGAAPAVPLILDLHLIVVPDRANGEPALDALPRPGEGDPPPRGACL
jgi:hypothetical protein